MKTYTPILPLPIVLINRMAPLLDVSGSLLYLIIRKNYRPSLVTRRRIQRAAGLGHELWSKEPHEISDALYHYCAAQLDPADPAGPQGHLDPATVATIVDETLDSPAEKHH